MVLVVVVVKGDTMAYFLKKSTLKGRTYLSISESFYNPEKKGTSQKTFKSLGSIETMQAKGMKDPIAHYKRVVDKLNFERKQKGVKKISDVSSERFIGYFLLKAIMNKLAVKKYIDYFKLTHDFTYDPFELISSLVFARAVKPCSKLKTFHEVLPELFEDITYSYDQLLNGLSFIGNNYEKFVEIFTHQTAVKYGLDTTTTYFDCTNFFFEIDREDDFRRKGPSKEGRKDPIVGLGLLLDHNQIPIGMKMYPGNESEKPVMRDVIASLKAKNNIAGRTIHVADKGLNCAQNIAFSKMNNDGYLFSKSVKGLSLTEKAWVLSSEGFKDVRDAKGKVLYRYKSCIDSFSYTIKLNGKPTKVKLKEKRLLTYNPKLAKKKRYEIDRMVEKARALTYACAKRSEYGEAGKYVHFTDKDGEKAIASINSEAIKKDRMFAGYNLLVTSEIDMDDRYMYETYHNLWRIEESFRVMKTDLDARPVYLQKEDSIKGHFLICYLTVLLERILQFKLLDNNFSSSDLFDFFKEFKVVKDGIKYVNATKFVPLIGELERMFDLPLTNYYLSAKQIERITSCKV